MGLADLLHAIPYVQNDADRDSRFPFPPGKEFRVQYPDATIKKYNGAGWDDWGAIPVYPAVLGEVGVLDIFRSRRDLRRWGGSPLATAAANTAAFANAFASGFLSLDLETGIYQVNDEVLPLDNWTINFLPGTKIQQMTVGKHGIKVVLKNNVWIKGRGTVKGPGVWSNLWAGIDGHDERGIAFYGCTNSGSTFMRVENFGLSGFVVLGGTNVYNLCPDVEGTHLLGTPLVAGGSYQFAYLIMHDLVYGPCDNVVFISPRGSYVNFGVNTVNNVGAGATGRIRFLNAYFSDIIGQHGGYFGTSYTEFPGFTAVRCHFIGLKVFSGSIGETIVATGGNDVDVSDCGGDGIQFGVSGTGSIQDCWLQGVAVNCARGGTCDGDIRRTHIDLISRNMSQRHFYVAQLPGQGPRDCTWRLDCNTSVEKGFLIAASTSSGNVLYWKGVNCSTGAPGNFMVDINGTAGLTIKQLDCSDTLGNMLYGFYAELGTGIVIDCAPNISGFAGVNSAAMRADVDVLWQGAGVHNFFDTGDHFRPITPLKFQRQTVAAGNVNGWKYTVPDLSAHVFEASLVGKKAGSADLGAFKTRVLVQRNGGGAVIPAVANNPDNGLPIVTAGFAGAFAWGVVGNAVRLLMNSGAAVNVDWEVEIKMLSRVG